MDREILVEYCKPLPSVIQVPRGHNFLLTSVFFPNRVLW